MRIDTRFPVPDCLAGVDTALRHAGGLRALLEADGVGCFVRCLLPLQLTGGVTLVVGTWLRVAEAEFGRAQASWESYDYEQLVLAGTLANAVPPFGEHLLHAPVLAGVRDRDELPYVTGSERPGVARILATTWDRDDVLGRADPGPAPPDGYRTGAGGEVRSRWPHAAG
ncbi:DUF2199 domain-containing protein [Actinacidiphila bryophytorum]|uniref:DUF2199 domain-containing protein n=1 Tax=Actinacidiphila bryophytorum TaxID=1436133 RepID=UPI002176C154|nr:DUF2199 domain-containing protein [Actinacidiphila bryophytorum]UWE07486.1 DUF2199 domain-containing protein [Actinacidiphila bryophytorum]